MVYIPMALDFDPSLFRCQRMLARAGQQACQHPEIKSQQAQPPGALL